MKLLITGGCGFLGSNLAIEAITRNDDVHVFDNLSRQGGESNLAWLQKKGKVTFTHEDIRSPEAIEKAVKNFRPDVIFHLAGQVAMTTSISDPRADFETNALGTLNLLESVRKFCPEAVILYSSTNKVYGDLEWVDYREDPTRYSAVGFENGFDEKTPLEFSGPYGCSKGSADQYILDYSRVFGLKTIVFRHSSIFGGRQFSTYDQGWIGWFIDQALKIKSGKVDEIEISGNGKQVRDILFVSDLQDCYFKAVGKINEIKGQAFNIGGGMEQSISILELFQFLDKRLGIKIRVRNKAWRQSDQKVFVANIDKAARLFGWKPKIGRTEGLNQMIDWVQTHG